MKKILTLVLAVALALTLCSAVLAEGYSGELKVWVPEATVEFTIQQIEAFKAANPEYADMTVAVEPVGEGDAAGKVIMSCMVSDTPVALTNCKSCPVNPDIMYSHISHKPAIAIEPVNIKTGSSRASIASMPWFGLMK